MFLAQVKKSIVTKKTKGFLICLKTSNFLLS